MCETCDKEYLKTLWKIANEFANSKKLEIKNFKNFMLTDEFKQYAAKRIPEIVKETPIFTVAEFENGKIKSIKEE